MVHCRISKMVGPKKRDFWPRINILTQRIFLLFSQWITLCQKVPKFYFQIFNVKNQLIFLKKKIQKYQFRLPFHVKYIFSRLDFWTTLFSKIMPNFWWTDIPCRVFFIFIFLKSVLILGQNLTFLGPTIFPQPNWYYWRL